MIWYKQDIILSVQYKIFNVQDEYKIKKIKMSVCLFACMYVCMHVYIWTYVWAPRGFGDLGRRAIYFQGAGEHW